ncbi:MAG: hypothetical protein KAJ51_06755 [Thermoplasmata archaeon]|nr:hypothetical protein [Thermoplasmata archaeon]
MGSSEMDSHSFITSIEEHLVTLAPITKFIIIKQLGDLKVTKDSLTPDKALIFINKMTSALVLCLGKDGSQLARKMMMKHLRQYAPGFLERQGMGETTV